MKSYKFWLALALLGTLLTALGAILSDSGAFWVWMVFPAFILAYIAFLAKREKRLDRAKKEATQSFRNDLMLTNEWRKANPAMTSAQETRRVVPLPPWHKHHFVFFCSASKDSWSYLIFYCSDCLVKIDITRKNFWGKDSETWHSLRKTSTPTTL